MKELFSAGVDVTKKCTLRCLHCFNFSGDEKETTCDEELTDKELITMATNILECNPKSMCMCGGEPLLRKDAIMEIANIAKDKYPNSSINMVSNGQLMTAQVAEDLWKAGFKNIQISLDGASPETVDWLRNKEGMYEAATSALRYLSESRKRLGIDTDICISFCPTKKNLPELEEVIDFCESLDINSFRVQPLMLLGRAKEFLREYVLSKAEYRDLARRLKNRNSINARSGERLETKWGDPMDHLLIEDVDELRFIQVNAYGDVLFTPYIPIAFGNIRNRSLKEYTEFDWNKVWNHELYKYVRSLMVTPEHMDLSEIVALPSIGYGQVRFDLLDPDWSNKMDDLLIQLQKEHAEVHGA